MKLNFNKLAYPGMFAQLGETGWIIVDRPIGFENKIRVSGFNDGEKFDKEIILEKEIPDPLQHLFLACPYLAELEFEPYDEDTSYTLQITSVIDELNKLGVNKVVVSFLRRHKISNIKMPFSPEIWADLANKNGKYLPACCANISMARNEFISGQREDGYLKAENLCNIVESIGNSHNDLFNGPHASEPLVIVKKIWDLIQQVADIRLGVYEIDSNKIEDAVLIISTFCSNYSWSSLYTEFPKYEDRVCLTHGLYTIIPAIKTISDKIRELDLGPIWGFALCPIHGEDDIFKCFSGISVWQTKDEAEQILKRWIDTEQVKANEIIIRPVKISIDKGIEFLESIENPWIDTEKLDPVVTNDEYYDAEKILELLEKQLNNKKAKKQVRQLKINLKTMTEQFNLRNLKK